MRRIAVALAMGLTLLGAQVAAAGSPHFINSAFSVSTSGTTITVSGKEAGLGDEEQIHVVLVAEAQCINPGDKHPRAANKASATAAGDFPVQNGKADFTLTATATFQPDCTPPMTLDWTSVTVTDTTNGLTQTFNL
jgi:hypothetical protein